MDNFTCRADTSLFQALTKINDNAQGFVCVVDSEQHLLGVLTDGDVRRALLSGANLHKSVMEFANTEPEKVIESGDLEHTRINLDSRITFVPVVDEDNKLKSILSKESVNFTPISTPRYMGNEVNYAIDAILSTWISSKGRYVEKFEADYASYLDVKHALSVTNGTVAIQLVLAALGIGPGDEVIVPNFTFAATINTVLHVGATPVLVDVDDSWTLNPDQIKEAITPKTKAIIPVHLYGQPAQMDQIMTIGEEYNLYIIEDAAEAHGAEFNGQKVGTIGCAGTFSFFANKIITTGEGGMVTTNDSELYEKMKVLRDHGMSPDKKYWHDFVGYNFRMTNIQAAIGCGQLEHIQQILKRRDELENFFRDELHNSPFVEVQRNTYDKRRKVNWLTSFTLKDDFAHRRDQLLEYLYSKGIEARPFFFPLSEMPIYQSYGNGKSFPIAERLSKSGFSLPTEVKLEKECVKRFCDELKTFFNGVQ